VRLIFAAMSLNSVSSCVENELVSPGSSEQVCVRAIRAHLGCEAIRLGRRLLPYAQNRIYRDEIVH